MERCTKCGAELKEGDAFCSNCGTPVGTAAAQPTPVTSVAAAQPNPTTYLDLATWGDRIIAYIIDIVILGAVLGVVRGILLIPSIFGSTLPPYVPWSSAGFDGIIYFAYFAWLDYAYGQSLGKMVMRIKVTGLEGQQLTLEQSLLESFGKAFFPVNFLDVILGWIFYTGKNQRLFTHLARTIVIKFPRTD